MAPPLENAPDTRIRLMEAALRIFAEKGFDGAGIREIAQAAEANSAMVQYHFGGKEGLYKAALRWVFETGMNAVAELPPLPEPGTREAQAEARQGFEAYIRAFFQDLGGSPCTSEGTVSPETWHAAHMVWSREMQFPREHMEEFLLQTVRPYAQRLDAYVAILRPDLDEDGRFWVSMSVHGQLLYLHNYQKLLALLRGRPWDSSDLEALLEHFVSFSLGGLGVPDSTASKGA